ncbi:MAG: hypothetical protein HRT81_17020 [Henriciella sp.]|nr:hypothetical protein [Henriciella sp.]
MTKTAILEAALEHYFNPEKANRLEDRVLSNMDEISERLSRVERNIELSLEAFGQYVFYWLARTDPLPDGEREAAQALAERRFEFFIGQVSRQLFNDRRWEKIEGAAS